MQLTVIRHLPTEWNKKGWLQGRRDIPILPLTDNLRKDIAEQKALLREQEPFDQVLASTLKRTRQTAGIYGYQAAEEPLLDELDFGPFEGKSREKLLNEHGPIWLENPRELVLGESIADLENRISIFIKKMKPYKKVLVFGHGSWIRALLSFYRHGHVNNMNIVSFANNECMTLDWKDDGSGG
ncbi:MAG TPA: histidine phosphatase family protein [Bacillaceae bacterium]